MSAQPGSCLTRVALDLARLLAGLAVAVAFLAGRDIYGAPFGGCEVSGFLTLQPGCSSWRESFEGFVVVLVIGIIGGRRIRAGLIGLVIVLVLAILGGLQAISHGDHLHVLESPGEVIFGWAWLSSPLLLGGVAAYGLMLLGYWIRRRRRGGLWK